MRLIEGRRSDRRDLAPDIDIVWKPAVPIAPQLESPGSYLRGELVSAEASIQTRHGAEDLGNAGRVLQIQLRIGILGFREQSAVELERPFGVARVGFVIRLCPDDRVHGAPETDARGRVIVRLAEDCQGSVNSQPRFRGVMEAAQWVSRLGQQFGAFAARCFAYRRFAD